MALFRYRKSGPYWYDFQFRGRRYRSSTKSLSKKDAAAAERARRRELEDGYNGIRHAAVYKCFADYAKEFLEIKVLTLSPASMEMERAHLKRLVPVFGRKAMNEIDAADIRHYQLDRLAQGCAPRTVNMEVATLRQMLRRNRLWQDIQQDVRMLATPSQFGMALNSTQEHALLKECLESRSRVLYPVVVLALSTGMRYSELRFLRWQQIDLEDRVVTVGQSKTRHGSGRKIPLNDRAMSAISGWAKEFPDRQMNHFVFPHERYGGRGRQGKGGGRGGFDNFFPYDLDSTKPATWKSAWKAARLRAGIPRVRFHDLRHTACTNMLEGDTSFPVLGALMGWSPATAIIMAKRYQHIQKAFKKAVAALNGEPPSSAGSAA